MLKKLFATMLISLSLFSFNSAEAKTIQNSIFSMDIPNSFRTLSASEISQFNSPSNVVYSAIDENTDSSIAISQHTTDYEVTTEMVVIVRNGMVEELKSKGINAYASDIFYTNNGHPAFIIEFVAGNYKQKIASVYLHKNRYNISYRYEINSGLDNVITDSLRSVRCNVAH